MKWRQKKGILRHPLGKERVFPLLFSVFWVSLVFQGILPSTLSAFILLFGETVTLLGFTLAATAWSGILQGARWGWEPFLAGRIGRWSDGPTGRIPLFVGSLIVAAAGWLLISIILPFPLWVAAILLVMLTGTSLTTLSDALAADEAVRTRSDSLLPLAALAQDLGAAAGPVLTYLLLESGADLWGIYAVAAVGFAGITGFWHRVDPATVQGGGGSHAASVCAAVPVEKDVLQRKERRP